MLRSLTTAKRENPFLSWQREMNQWFDRFNKEIDFPRVEMEEFYPKVELKETDRGYTIKAEVPGMSENDLTISLKDNNLILEGEKKTESKREDTGYYFSELSYGHFYRSIPLEEQVLEDNVKANYKNGILTIQLEKTQEQTGTKKIPIMRS